MKKHIYIYTIGGYNYVGKNMTLVDLGNHAIIFDAGLNMEQYTKLNEIYEIKDNKQLNEKILINYDVIPDLKHYKSLINKVDLIIITHAHLDHLGALPYIIHHFKNPTIIATPYTAEILRKLNKEYKNEKMNIKSIVPNSSIKIGNTLVELIYITHSIPQTVVAKVVEDDLTIMYANDFKLDHNPIFGGKVNYDALTDSKPDVLILDSTRIELQGKTPSENVVESMIKDIVELPTIKNKGIIMTTFSSHIARLKTMEKIGKQLKRKVLFLGRSLKNYIEAAENIGLVKFESEIISFKGEIRKALKKIDEDYSNYLLVMTGHQGEKGSVLREIATGNIKLNLNNYVVIFSCSKIPTPTALANREFLEMKLQEQNVPFFSDVHVSGHASKEDLRTFIEIIKPKLVIPAHGGIDKRSKLALLCKEIGVPFSLLNDNEKMVIEKE
ncbi:MAG: MBL fold metallo-hydrolase [Candidatus Woesearchaeota archaeon]